MADKGGKRAVSSNGPSKKDMKKKDETSSKQVKKAVFESDSEDSVEELPNGRSVSPVSGGKASLKSTSFKGDKGKEASKGKTGKDASKGGASPSSKTTPVIAVLKLEDLPMNARCLMDCEVASILNGVAEYLPSLSDDPAIKIPDSFQKAREYAESGDHYESSEFARRELNKLKQAKLSDAEICIFGNACPVTVDEAFALLPSLKAKKEKTEGFLKVALINLQKLKKSKLEEEEFSFPDPPF